MTGKTGCRDIELIRRAGQGEADAWHELIARHRADMLRWAGRIVPHRQAAEDVVQESLLQLFRHIGRLEDPSRLLPWLRKIVRNRALMELRSSENRRAARSEPLPEEGPAQPAAVRSAEPSLMAAGREAVRQTEHLLARLGERERQVASLQLLAGLSAEETGRRLGLSRGAVHTALARARAKLADGWFDEEARLSADARRRRNRPSYGHAMEGSAGMPGGAYDTLCWAMLASAWTAGKRGISLSDVFAATGHSFRFQTTPDLGISGPYAYDWRRSVRDGWSHLGLSGRTLGGPGASLDRPEQLAEQLEQWKEALDRGRAVIVWGAGNAEFGLVTGYDDTLRCWIATDTTMSGKRIPYARLGRGRRDTEWFSSWPAAEADVGSRSESLLPVLELAASRLRGSPGDPAGQAETVSGQQAYRLWIEAFEQRRISSPLSASYHLAVMAEARGHAAAFLERAPSGARFGRTVPRNARPALQEALRHIRASAQAWQEAARLFPLPFGGDTSAPGPTGHAARLLARAAASDLQAADALDEAAWLWHPFFSAER
ncbi:RNA polymerase sigma factor [Paenibacillus albicereus]|uniref:RNA polymerase sigma factor n=1 Tax=Paenibacillus albicereus TaxID=2726185 RepID=A0A6H2GY34_9BACL|nr:RNA polymerase sigma factor [Paenibacillus albicereus]QJC52086.1 RNA polymerase sigma factor [Paenibacillus albicereus]